MTQGAGPSGGAREAVVSEKRGFSIVWLIPLVAFAVGAYLAYDAFASSGPTITITFKAADGLTAGKTKVKYKSVDVGTVQSVDIAKDLSHVIVTCSTSRNAGRHFTEGTRFWVVRPRIGAGGISGLGTLVSGAYISNIPGPPDAKRARHFVGLESPPIAPENAPGLKLVLHAEALGGVDVGSPILFRQEQVGELEGHRLADDGKSVQLDLYIDEKYKQLVTTSSRFWNASGVSVSAGIGGVDVQTESLEALVAGGITFDSPTWGDPKPAEAGASYWLHESLAKMEENAYRYGGLAIVVEAPQLGSLKVGDRVYYREEAVGAVVSHSLATDSRSVRIHLNIQNRYASLVRSNSVFWNASGISANLGFKGLHIHTESLQALLSGGIGFATPNSSGSRVKAGSVFELQPELNEKWLAWKPLVWRGPPGERPKEAAQPEKKEGLIGRFFHHEDKKEEEAAGDHDASQPHPAESKKHGFLHGLFHRGK